jgi:hypothetical protein
MTTVSGLWLIPECSSWIKNRLWFPLETISLTDGKAMAKQCSETHKGAKVYHAYQAKHGLAADLTEIALQALGVRTHQVKVVEQAIQMAKGTKWTIIEGQSRGGRAIDMATRAFASAVQETFWIATYGSAKIIDGERFASVTNNISNGDFVPFYGDPFAYVQARLFGNPCVKFLSPMEKGTNHSIRSPTYMGAMKKNAYEFNKFILTK